LERDWRRTERVGVTMRPGELADLRVVSAAWQVPVSTVCWVILHDALRRWRRERSEVGESGASLAMGLRSLRRDQEAAGISGEGQRPTAG
jgi:hypothetical protein